MDNAQIEISEMCQKHQSLLVRQAGYGPNDGWRGLLIVAQVVLFQMCTTDKKLHERTGGDITKFKSLGCLACLHPDYFGEVVEAAKDPSPGALKALGERYIANSAKEKDNG